MSFKFLYFLCRLSLPLLSPVGTENIVVLGLYSSVGRSRGSTGVGSVFRRESVVKRKTSEGCDSKVKPEWTESILPPSVSSYVPLPVSDRPTEVGHEGYLEGFRSAGVSSHRVCGRSVVLTNSCVLRDTPRTETGPCRSRGAFRVRRQSPVYTCSEVWTE